MGSRDYNCPLLLAVVVAYLLCPIVDYLEKQKLSFSSHRYYLSLLCGAVAASLP